MARASAWLMQFEAVAAESVHDWRYKEVSMADVAIPSRTLTLNLRTFGFIVATRAMLGVGLGLLAASKMEAPVRRRLGALLAAIGLVTTIPAAGVVLPQLKAARSQFSAL